MARAKLKLDERRIRFLLAAFFLALAIPAAVLVARAYGQLKWEAFRSNQVLAEDFAARVDSDLRAAVAAEEARSFGDYSFLVVEGNAAANFVQRSPLSAFPVASSLPGGIGYFQVDAAGTLTTPLLPASNVDASSFGIGPEELAARRALFTSISDVLAANRLVSSARDDADAAAAPATAGALAPQASVLEKDVRSQDATDAERGGAAASASAPAARNAPTAPAAPTENELRRMRPKTAGPPAAADTPALRNVGGNDEAVKALPDANGAPSLAFSSSSAQLFQQKAAKAEQTQAAFDKLAPAEAEPSAEAPVESKERAASAAAPPPAAAGAREEVPRLDEAAALVKKDANVQRRSKRQEQTLVPEPQAAVADAAAGVAGAAAAKLEFRVRTFESELDPFSVGSLDTGHLVMFRNVWRSGQRYIQGVLIDRERFVGQAVESAFRASSLAAMSDLSVTYRGAQLGAVGATGASYESSTAGLAGSLLYRARLSPPFGDLELALTVNQLPRAPGAALLLWISIAFAAVLLGGFYFMYRFALGQLRLARQQQDFVSAVSHELKTPLTSIRMYGEMLKAGWADDAKKQTYYDYIHSESERLSRLIENVLQLARLTRNTQHLEMKRVAVAELVDMARSKIATQVERAGFALAVRNEAPADAEVLVDADCFTQVVINLVDNALKFSSGAQRKAVEVVSRRESDGRVLFTVRDFGPGIPKGQMKKIFELFYRPENELTRETVGTGIGLALVQQLAAAMGGRVDVRNCEPGAEFRVSFPPAS